MTAQAVVLQPGNARDRMAFVWKKACEYLQLDKPVMVTVDEFKSRRSLDQNRKLNAMCGDLAEQVKWHGQMLSKDDWRHMFVAAYRKEQRVVPGFDGGFIVLGASSRGLTVPECIDVIEMMFAFGAEKGVRWSEQGGPL